MNAPTLTTVRLLLKPFSLTDAEAVFAYRSDPEVAKYQNFHPTNADETKAFILPKDMTFNTEDSWFQLGIYCGEKVIGDIGIHFIGPLNSQCEIGYTLAWSEHGKGYGQEAVSVVVDYLFDILKKHRITASLDPRNAASIRLLERVGFRREGCFLKSYYNNGVWEDDLVYGILEEEWGDRQPGVHAIEFMKPH